MKKIYSALVVASLSLLCLSSQAQIVKTQPRLQACPFADSFYIGGASISSLSARGNIAVKQYSQTSFVTSCADNNDADSGYAYLKVINPNKSFCNLIIKDGPFEMNPTVASVSCSGNLQFTGMDHNYGTYVYVLKFAP